MTLSDMAKKIEGEFSLTATEPSAPCKLKTAEAAFTFMLAGNAYFTIRSMKTGTRFTYRVSRSKCSRCGEMDCNCWKNPLLFVKVLTGSQNTDYSYVGYIKDKQYVYGGAKAKVGRNAPSAVAFEWLFNALSHNNLPKQVEMWHEGRCGRCGRKLTVPESIEAGIGPECAERMAA
jgi:hypothetical protein